MAGMLPGVEAARRRRFHHSNANFYGSENTSAAISSCSTRRSSFCLYAISSYVFHSNSTLRKPAVSNRQQGLPDGDESSGLCAAAREAKRRLDERLQPQRRFESKRVESIATVDNNSRQRSSRRSFSGDRQLGKPEVVPKSKKKNWLKLRSWKSSEQEECAVCLEQLSAGSSWRRESLMQVPCGHRFHTKCLMPWLEGNLNNNPHCPCCRMEIPST